MGNTHSMSKDLAELAVDQKVSHREVLRLLRQAFLELSDGREDKGVLYDSQGIDFDYSEPFYQFMGKDACNDTLSREMYWEVAAFGAFICEQLPFAADRSVERITAAMRDHAGYTEDSDVPTYLEHARCGKADAEHEATGLEWASCPGAKLTVKWVPALVAYHVHIDMYRETVSY